MSQILALQSLTPEADKHNEWWPSHWSSVAHE